MEKMKLVRLAWKYRRPLWKYRGLIRHRKEILGAAVAAVAIGTAAVQRAKA
jgi:hypothetical protein